MQRAGEVRMLWTEPLLLDRQKFLARLLGLDDSVLASVELDEVPVAVDDLVVLRSRALSLAQGREVVALGLAVLAQPVRSGSSLAVGAPPGFRGLVHA